MKILPSLILFIGIMGLIYLSVSTKSELYRCESKIDSLKGAIFLKDELIKAYQDSTVRYKTDTVLVVYVYKPND